MPVYRFTEQKPISIQISPEYPQAIHAVENGLRSIIWVRKMQFLFRKKIPRG